METKCFPNIWMDLNRRPLTVLDDSQPSKLGGDQICKFIQLRTVTAQQESRALIEELNRVNAENKKLAEMLTVMCNNYTVLKNQLMEYTRKSCTTARGRKRKTETRNNIANKNGNYYDRNNIIMYGASDSVSDDEDSSKKRREELRIKPKVLRFCNVPTDASNTSFVVKDGYQWRKCGQKVTGDNPFPRAYFKCSFAPTCQVKKKVQRSTEDPSIVVVSYEGDHNHPPPPPSKPKVSSSSNQSFFAPGNLPSSTSPSSSGTSMIKFTRKTVVSPKEESKFKVPPEFQQYFV